MTATTTFAPVALSASNLARHLPIPAAFAEVGRRLVTVDGVPAELIRLERTDGRNRGLGGEHVSAVIDAGGRLKGFARLDRALAEGTLPSRDRAREIALEFLERFAPDLLAHHEIKWVEPHDETIRADGDTVTIAGMKVKIFNHADGRWFWAIVGTDGGVAVFERDIVWITIPGHRQTEKWLHDSWLAGQSG